MLRQVSDWEGTLWGKPDWADRPDANRAEWTTRARNKPGTVYKYNDVRVNALALATMSVWRRPAAEGAEGQRLDPIGASQSWRWYGYENSWIVVDGEPMQSVSRWRPLGRGSLHQRHGHGAVRLSHAAARQMEGSPDPFRGVGAHGAHADAGAADLRIHELVPEHRPQVHPERPGERLRARRQRPQHDLRGSGERLVAVVRWIDNKAMDEFVKRLLAAVGGSSSQG
jgi:hypothetical protein